MILKNQKLKDLEKFLLREPEHNAFALWDLRRDLKNSDFYVLIKENVLGYALIYHGTDVPSVIIRVPDEHLHEFAGLVQLPRAIVHIPYSQRALWRGPGKMYRVYVMAASPAMFPGDPEIRVVRNPASLRHLISNPEPLLKNAIVFGLYEEGKVVSMGAVLAHMPEVWVIGAVTTVKEYRNRGFATRVMRHIIGHAYGQTRRLVLWVRSDNMPALHIYQKLGFVKIGENAWINIGVNVVP
ncbi:MAG: GNAT family N-acetyltransferase [Euryarchaeota archaeon]|nr:GNAT family N-acetyltransferase [Euryarchaeota archaeon]